MIVYIEDAIIDNLVINFIILSLTIFSLREKNKIIKTLFSAFVGCLFAVLLTFFNLPLTYTIIIKILTGLIMCCIVIHKFTLKKWLLFFTVFLSFTFLMGGFCFFIIFLFGGKIYSVEKMQYDLPVSLGFIFALLGIYIYLLIKAIKIFYKKQKLEKFNYKLLIKANNKKIKINAYLDSGNLLQDNLTGLPVVIVNFNIILNLFDKEISLIDFLTEKLNHKIKGRYIDIGTVTGKSKMFVFRPTQANIIDPAGQVKNINVLIGISSLNAGNRNFEALLSPLAI